MSNKAAIVLKFLIGVILGAIVLLITYKIAGAVLSLVFLQDDSMDFNKLFETIDKLDKNRIVELLYFISEDHILIGFSKDVNIVNNFKRPKKCENKTCICKCNNEANAEVCDKPSAQCLNFDNDLKLTYNDKELFIQGRFKQILSIERTDNLIKIK